MRKFIHVHASQYMFEKKVSYDATVIKPDRNQLVYNKNGYYNFHRSKRWPSGQGLGLRGRGFDPYSGRHEHCVLEQDILLSKSTCNTQEAVGPSDMTKNCFFFFHNRAHTRVSNMYKDTCTNDSNED